MHFGPSKAPIVQAFVCENNANLREHEFTGVIYVDSKCTDYLCTTYSILYIQEANSI